MPLAIGVDVGGTKVAAGVVDDDGSVLTQVQRPTPVGTAQATEDAIAEVVAALLEVHPEVVAVGIGAAGFVDHVAGRVVFAPHLAWRDEPLRDEVAARVGLPVSVENDATAMAWGEHRYGAGRDATDLFAITIGTGIGGGIVLSGVPYRGHRGLAAEFGHVVVVPGGHTCSCGNRGCWEEYCSGLALEREAALVVADSPWAARRLLELAGKGRVTGRMVTSAATEGDPVAVELVADLGRWLGRGLAGLVAALDPARIVIGGGVSQAGDLLLDPARAELAATLSGRGHRVVPVVVPAQLGVLAGLIGAADLARAGLVGFDHASSHSG